MGKQLQLREIKKARNKLQLLEKAQALLKQKSFKHIHVDEICRAAELSQATFFNFFPQKEGLLIYFIEIWQVHRNVELFKEPKYGVDGIRYLFERVVDDAEENNELMLSIISYISELKEDPISMEVTDAEKNVLFPDQEFVFEIKTRSLYEMFTQFVAEAMEQGEIALNLPIHDIVKILFTILYGAFLTGNLFNQRNGEQRKREFMKHYESHLKLLL